MHRIRIAAFAILVVVSIPGGPFSANAFGQVRRASVPTPPPLKNPQAIQIVQTALTALGGPTAIGQIQGWQLQGQNVHTTASGNETDTFMWEAAGTEFRTQTVGSSGTTVMVTGHGTPAIILAGTAKALPVYVISAMIVPGLVGQRLLEEFQDPNCSIQSGGTTTLGDASVNVVRTLELSSSANSLVTPQTWYFDSSSGLPLRVEYRLPVLSGPRLSVASSMDFSNYGNVGGTLYPFHIVRSHSGKQSDLITIQSVTPNATISPTDFNAPTGGGQ